MNPEKFKNTIDGIETGLFKLTNSSGVQVFICNYGAALVSIKIPGKNGKLTDVILGYDSLDGYLNGNPYFGSIVGRFANRIGKAEAIIEDKLYKLSANIGEHHLHGGTSGFSMKAWKIISASPNELVLEHFSEDGDQGYPGNLTAKVRYLLTNDNSLVIEMQAKTDKTTLVNFTSHPFFNLEGEGTPSITSHLFQINASGYLPIDENLVTTGEIEKVSGTPFDFQKPAGLDFEKNASNSQLIRGRGYDHCFALDNENNFGKIAAQVFSPNGICLEVFINQPGLQFYTGNWLDGSDIGKTGTPYIQRSAFCLEAQNFPDAPNKKHFPNPLLQPGETYYHKTIYKFSCKNFQP